MTSVRPVLSSSSSRGISCEVSEALLCVIWVSYKSARRLETGRLSRACPLLQRDLSGCAVAVGCWLAMLEELDSTQTRRSPSPTEAGAPRRGQWLGVLILLVVVMWVAVKRIGLGTTDVLLVYAVGAYAVQQQRWNRNSRGLLGESGESEPPMRWGDFVCEHHQLLSCVVKGRGRSRQENFLAVATSTLAMLYWKAFFRSKLRMASLQALKDSIWTLLVSKGVQQVITRR